MYDENMNTNYNENQDDGQQTAGQGYPYNQNQAVNGQEAQAGSQNQIYGNQEQPAGGQNQAYVNQSQPYGGQNQTYGGGSGYQGYTGYQNQNYQGYTGQAPEPAKKPKKHSMAKKVAGIAAAALMFGIISGGTMVGINMLAGSMKGDEPTVPQATEKVTLSDEEIDKIKKDLAVEVSNAKYMDVSAIVEEAMPSVVAINNTMLYQSNSLWWGSQTYEVPSSGSGIIVGQNDTELLIVSNNHVVENATELSVVFIDGTSLDGTVKGTDAETDLAVVAVPLDKIPAETMSKISVAELGSSDDLKVGEGVVAIGNALGYGQSVTVGYVSALNREVKTNDSQTRKLLQTDAAINPGNSGGALLNMKGEVIGINAAKYASTDVEGVGYAIPISQAQDIINSLMVRRSGDKVEEGSEGYLGIQGVTVDANMVQQLDIPEGVYVYKILDGGAASKTDLREKDVITKFDGQTIRTMASLQDLLKYYKVGETVEMTVQSLENGEYVERTITITLGKQVSAE